MSLHIVDIISDKRWDMLPQLLDRDMLNFLMPFDQLQHPSSINPFLPKGVRMAYLHPLPINRASY